MKSLGGVEELRELGKKMAEQEARWQRGETEDADKNQEGMEEGGEVEQPDPV